LTINGVIQTFPPVLLNNGKEFATGVDFNLTTRDVPSGIVGQLTAGYINEFSSVIPTSTSEDFFPNIIPASLLAGNVYRVGFISPFQSTLALTYKTKTGWRVTPRVQYNIGYPSSLGLVAPAIVNGVALNVPNTDGLIGNAPNGPACFVDPMNPGSVINPNIVACRGNAEKAFPGAKLSPPDSTTDLTVEYSPPASRVTFGVNVNNVFGEILSGPVFNARYQPLATGITGPLTGFSTNPTNYTNYPSARPLYANSIGGNQTYVNTPDGFGRTFYFYTQWRL
jgi:hypothetical protein